MYKEPTLNKFDDLEKDWAIVLKFAARQLNGSRRPLKRSRTLAALFEGLPGVRIEQKWARWKGL